MSSSDEYIPDFHDSSINFDTTTPIQYQTRSKRAKTRKTSTLPDPSIKLDFEFQETIGTTPPKYTGTIPKSNQTTTSQTPNLEKPPVDTTPELEKEDSPGEFSKSDKKSISPELEKDFPKEFSNEQSDREFISPELEKQGSFGEFSNKDSDRESIPEHSEKTDNLSTEFRLNLSFQVFLGNSLVKEETDSFTIPDPTITIDYISTLIQDDFNLRNPDEPSLPLADSPSYSTELLFNMAMPIESITKLINEYDGEVKNLDSFVKNIDTLWGYINAYEAADKTRFLLVLRLRLTKKAAEAVKNDNFENWANVKQALINGLIPHRNAEKAELKLCAIRQKPNEDIETYAKRVEEALANLSMMRNQEDQNESFKKEDDRRARRAFENGLSDYGLRNKAIAKGNATLREAIDYIIEQELRQLENKPRTDSQKICNFCKLSGHLYSECRKRLGQNNNTNGNTNTRGREVTCFKCKKTGHYANACPDTTNQQGNSSGNNEQPTTSKSNFGVMGQNSYQRNYTNRDNRSRRMKFFEQNNVNIENLPSTSSNQFPKNI